MAAVSETAFCRLGTLLVGMNQVQHKKLEIVLSTRTSATDWLLPLYTGRVAAENPADSVNFLVCKLSEAGYCHYLVTSRFRMRQRYSSPFLSLP